MSEEVESAVVRWTSYNLSFADSAAAVGRCQCGGARLRVPRNNSVLWRTADWQCEYAVGVTITVAVVMKRPTVAWGPHKDGAKTTTTLSMTKSSQKLHLRHVIDGNVINAFLTVQFLLITTISSVFSSSP